MYLDKVIDRQHYTIRVMSDPLSGDSTWTEYRLNRWAGGPTGRKSTRDVLGVQALNVHINRNGKVAVKEQTGKGTMYMRFLSGVTRYGF